MEAALRALASVNPHTTLRIDGGFHHPPMEPTARNQALWRLARQAAEQGWPWLAAVPLPFLGYALWLACGQLLAARLEWNNVAYAITGTRWSGPRFFGLRDKAPGRTDT